MQDVLKSGAGSYVSLNFEIAADVWNVVADPGEFETALVNLVINARDAMPEGGTVTISASNDTDKDRVEISVSDTGLGIPDDVAAKVFDPFFTTKGVGKATGLGLSQVHGFAYQAGGAVALKTALGEGTTVTIFLPRGSHDLGAEAKADTIAGSGTVLLVEDNPEVAEASMSYFEELGYTVRWVPSASAALVEIDRNVIDIVCSDIVMPGKIDGIALAHAIRTKHPKLPILLMTGYSAAAKEVATQFPILRKPYQLHELSSELQKLLPSRVMGTGRA